MILQIHQFKDGIPKQLHGDYDARKLDLEFVDFYYLKSIALAGSAELVKETITFRGTLTSEVEQVCNRCLDCLTSVLTAPFDLTYAADAQETIDTTDDLRDILILCHPDHFLCRSDCRGLCANCGANLNKESC